MSASAKLIDYDALMRANLARVFGERDPARRLEAIRALYVEDAVLHEPQASVVGHAAISDAVAVLLASLPADFIFSPVGRAVGHHGLGRLNWESGPRNGPISVTGTDVVQIEDGRIRSLHVLLNPSDA